MRHFEIRDLDLAGRTGWIRTKSGTIQTPAIFPVVHPFQQEIPPDEIRSCGFEAIMTNSYIVYRQSKGKELKPIHEILKFSGPIATDSGGYQVLEYGQVEADPTTMVRIQEEIGSDIAVILDMPTKALWPREKAEESVSRTLEAASLTMRIESEKPVLWVGTIQGGKYLDLVGRCTKRLVELGFPILALGGPVEVMENYDFETLAKMIITAKKQMPHSLPLHLFGAGHPLTVPLACALGCDTFDSASYILYARGNRYFTDNSTARLENLSSLPCGCRVCSTHTIDELKQVERKERTKLLALHNLYMLAKSVIEVRQAIHEGRLWELVAQKSRCHPKLWDAFMQIPTASDFLEPGTPVRKSRALFFSSTPDHERPEVARHFERILVDYIPSSDRLVIVPMPDEAMFSHSKWAKELLRRNRTPRNYTICIFSRAFGLIPVETSEIYPLSQHVVSRDGSLIDNAIDRTQKFVSRHKFKERIALTDASHRKEMKALSKAIKARLLEIRMGRGESHKGS